MMDFDKASLERLLGRVEEDVLDACDASRLCGQHALVTGAGGSVGAALLRKLGRYAPASLTLFDHSESHLFQIESELRQIFPSLPVAAVLGDVSRRAEIRAACRRHVPTVIYHAAAYKHVAMAETAVIAAARVNVLGTVEMVGAAREVDARLVLVSSDKAAAPRGVMGATKRLAELFALQGRSEPTPPIAVRFGNVLGSSGSVLEIMVRAAAAGRKLPITSPDATRFFMTAEEAASLVLKAGLIGGGGEVFWLEMGAPLRIGDLAARVVAYATPPDIEPAGIDVIGLRPGEKLREELTTHGLEMRPTSHPRIWSAVQRDVEPASLGDALRRLRRGCASGDAAGVLEALTLAVPDFEPSAEAVEAARSQSLRAPRPSGLPSAADGPAMSVPG